MPSRCRGGIAEERSNPQPMMNGMEKSDSVIVAVKSVNKGTPVPAEPMEPRTEPKGNPKSQSMRRTQDRESVSQAADRIRQFVQREPGMRLTALLHHITVDALRERQHARAERERARADAAEARCEELRRSDVDARSRAGSFKWQLDSCRGKLEASRVEVKELRRAVKAAQSSKAEVTRFEQRPSESRIEAARQPPVVSLTEVNQLRKALKVAQGTGWSSSSAPSAASACIAANRRPPAITA